MQVLACLKWLCEFQIVALIPLTQEVAYTDLSDLTGVSATQIQRIVRITATVGFLCEPQAHYVAHTTLSREFIRRPSFLDALMFISDTMVPTAMCMAEATRQEAHPQHIDVSPYQIAMKSSSSLAAACESDAKLQRRVSAFQRLAARSRANAVTHLLSCIDWETLGQGTVVEVNAVSTATAKALAARNAALRFVVQMRDIKQSDAIFSARQVSSSEKLIVQRRAPGDPQNERSAAVYLLHMPDPFLFASSVAHTEVCTAELRIHFDLIRAKGDGNLILIADVLQDPDTPTATAEAVAALQDLLLLQIGHKEAFDMARLMELLECMHLDPTRLTIINQLSSPDYPILMFKLRVDSLSASEL
ncbi:hypothetical protein BJ878DRAFT_530573 [Calycina marina]|uniref:Uncharacterized protein n=1 Tax=Calycina marina TaxID=1763456 RepID=A0A9P8CAS9_9HELO|nr:hypothetical protein BJ878DRAFT_530573 [Calycina marina]